MRVCHRPPRRDRPSRNRGTTRLRIVACHAVVASMLVAGEAAAQNRPEVMAFPPDLTGYMRMGVVFHENFFQATDDDERRDVMAGVLELRAEEKLGRTDAYRADLRADVYRFQRLGTSPGVMVGVRKVQGVSQFSVSAIGQWRRPRFDHGDELEQANILGGAGTYSVKVARPLELVALGEYSHDWLQLNADLQGLSYDAGAAVRVRTFGHRVTFEIGRLVGARDLNGVQQYANRTDYVVVRTTAIPRTYLSVRYRNRFRDYATDDPDASNYRREDRRRQVTAYLDISVGRNLVWNLSGGFEQADSTRPGRGFRSRQLGSTLSMVLPPEW